MMKLTTFFYLTEEEKKLLSEKYRSSKYPGLTDKTALKHYKIIKDAFECGTPGDDEMAAVRAAGEEFIKNFCCQDSRMMYEFLFTGIISGDMRKLMRSSLESVLAVKTEEEIRQEMFEERQRNIIVRSRAASFNRQLFDGAGGYVFAVDINGKLKTNCLAKKYDKLKYWSGFVGTAVGRSCIAALKSNGDAVFFENGLVPSLGDKWKNIKQIMVIGDKVYGLKGNGTVVCTEDSSCTEWRDIVLLQTGHGGCVGVTKDGGVVNEGLPYNEYNDAIAVSGDYVLRRDGIVVKDSIRKEIWSDVISVCSLSPEIGAEAVFLKYDRVLISSSKKINSYIKGFNDVVAVACEGNVIYIVLDDGSLYEVNEKGRKKKIECILPVVPSE